MSRLVEIGDVTSKVETWDPLSSISNKPFHYIDISSVDREAKQVSATQLILPSDAPSRARQIVKTGDILVSTVRPNLNAVAEVPKRLNGAIASTGYCVLRPYNERVNSRYLYFWVRSTEFIKEMVKRATGASYPAVSDKIVKDSKIPLLPLPEQKRIAAILDKADSIRRKRQEAVLLTEELLRSVFQDMFGDPVTNPKGWEIGTVENALESGRLLDVQDGNHGEKHPKVADFSSDGIPFIMANCLVNGQLDTEKAYKLESSWLKKLRVGFAKTGDLLLSHKGTVGEVAIVSDTFPLVILSPQVTYYRIGTDLDAKFLAGFFSTAWFQSILKNEAEQSTRAYIGITRQRLLPLMLPPIELQREFACQAAVIEKLMAKYWNTILENDNLFNSLLQGAFKGIL